MMKMYKFLFSSTLALGTIMSISSQNWMGIWLGLEINLLSMIPLMNSSNNALSTEASIKYFITQALASTVILFSIILMLVKFSLMNQMIELNMMINSAMLTKMGAAPFHFWFPEVIEGLTWVNSMILLTWQKIAPMVIIMYTNLTVQFIIMSILLSMFISSIMGLNQVSLRKIMVYSSINHMGWMLSSMLISQTIWMIYLTIYCIITINITSILSLMNTSFMSQIFNYMSNSNMMKLFFMMNFLSLGGLPPFLGFLPKWLTIQTLISQNLYMLTIIMIMSTMVPLYFYTRITFSTLLINSNEINFYQNNKIQLNNITMINFMSITGLILITSLNSFI